MKITIATGPNYPLPPLLGGAMAKIWDGLAGEFAAQGHHVTVVARSFPGQPRTETIRGVRYLRFGGYAQGASLAWDLVRDFVHAALVVGRLPKADILVINDFWLPVFAGMFRRGAGRIVINAGRFPKNQYWLYRHAARIAAVSGAVREAIARQAPALADRIKVLPNPVDTRLLAPVAAPASSREGKTLLFVGRLHPEKGIHLLLEAFGGFRVRHPAWKLRIVGPVAADQGGGGEAYRQQLEALARGLSVEFTGPILDPHQLAEVYRSADLFCYPSLAEKGESFGVAPLEAMACGVPVVVSSLECFRDFVTEGETGFSFDHRGNAPAAALAAVLERAMTGPAAAAAGRRAAEMARGFSYAAVAGKYLADFDALLARPSAMVKP